MKIRFILLTEDGQEVCVFKENNTTEPAVSVSYFEGTQHELNTHLNNTCDYKCRSVNRRILIVGVDSSGVHTYVCVVPKGPVYNGEWIDYDEYVRKYESEGSAENTYVRCSYERIKRKGVTLL